MRFLDIFYLRGAHGFNPLWSCLSVFFLFPAHLHISLNRTNLLHYFDSSWNSFLQRSWCSWKVWTEVRSDFHFLNSEPTSLWNSNGPGRRRRKKKKKKETQMVGTSFHSTQTKNILGMALQQPCGAGQCHLGASGTLDLIHASLGCT